jgi:hypothetical protein
MKRKLIRVMVAGLMTLGVAVAQQGMGRRGDGSGLAPRDGTGFGVKSGQRGGGSGGGTCGKNCVCDGTGRGAGQQQGKQGGSGTMQRGRRR